MDNELVVKKVAYYENNNKKLKQEKRLYLGAVSALFAYSIAFNNIEADISMVPQLLAFYSFYQLGMYFRLKGKNDYIIEENKAKIYELKKGA